MLRAPEIEDVDIIMAWENDTSQWDTSSNIAPYSRKQIWDYITNYNADIFETGSLRLIIADISESKPVGMIDLFDFDIINRRAFVGIFVDKSARGAGIGIEALDLLCKYTYNRLGMHQLAAVCSVLNNDAVEMFEKCDFTVCGRLRSWLRRGESYDDAFALQKLLVHSDKTLQQ